MRAIRRVPGHEIRYAELGRTRTDAAGRYRLGPLDEGVTFIVEAASEGLFTARRPAMAGMRRDFNLGRPGTLVGRVTVDRARPAPDVLVALIAFGRPVPWDRHHRWSLHRWTPGRLTRSDEEGAYRFTDLPPGVYNLFAFPREHTINRYLLRPVRAGEETRADLFVGGAGKLVGKVFSVAAKDRLVPLQGALVYLGNLRQRATSGIKGRYEIRGLASGLEYTVRVSAPDHLEASYTFTAPQAAEHERDFYLEPAGCIRGRVTDLYGRCIPGAKVRLDVDEREHPDLPTVETGRTGEFSLPVTVHLPTAPTVRVRATAPGFAWTVSRPLGVEPGGRVESIALTLSKGATLRGRVRDEDGEPVVGAFVGLRQGETLRASVCSLDEGRYCIEHVPSGQYRLEIRPWDAVETHRSVFARSVREHVVVAGDGELELDLTLRKGMAISGRVVGTDRRPVEGARVWALRGPDFEKSTDPELQVDCRMAFTDSQGRFTITGIRDDVGSFSLGVFHDDYLDEPCNNVQPGTTGVIVTLEGRYRLRGRVFLAGSGRPVPRFQVLFGGYRKRDDVVPFMYRRRNSYISTEGTFEVEIPAGWYRFTVGTDDGFASRLHEVHIQAGVQPPELAIALMKGVTIRGRVRTSEGRRPAAANVKVICVDGERKEHIRTTPTTANGEFTVGGLAPGGYELQVSSVQLRGVWLAARTVRLAAHGSEQEVALDLERCGRLRVRVLDERDRPVEGARVKVLEEDGSLLFTDIEMCWSLCCRKHRAWEPTADQWQSFLKSLFVTRKNGELETRFLRPATYTLAVSADGFEPRRETVTVGAGGRAEVIVRLTR